MRPGAEIGRRPVADRIRHETRRLWPFEP